MKNFKKIFILLLICALALVLVGCNPKNEPGKKVYYDNETDKLIFSTQELDLLDTSSLAFKSSLTPFKVEMVS